MKKIRHKNGGKANPARTGKKSLLNFAVFLIVFLGLLSSQALFANFRLAEKAFQEKLYNFAAQYYRKTIVNQLRQSDFDTIEAAYYKLALSYFLAKEKAKALEAFSSYLTKYPYGRFTLQALYFKGLISKENEIDSDFLDEAMAELQKFKQKANDNPVILNNSIQPLLRLLILSIESLAPRSLTKADDLLKDFQAWLSNQKTHTNANVEVIDNALANLKPTEAELAFKLGRINRAIQLYQQVYSDKNFSRLSFYSPREIALTLLRLYIDTEDYAKAEKLVLGQIAGTQLQKDKDELNFLKNHLVYLKGDFAGAAAAYKNYLYLEQDRAAENPYYVEALIHLAMAYEKLGQSIIALKTLKQVYEDPIYRQHHNRSKIIAYGMHQRQNNREAMQEIADAIYTSAGNDAEKTFAIVKKIELLSSQPKSSLKEAESKNFERNLSSFFRQYEELSPSLNEKQALYKRIASLLYESAWLELSQKYFLQSYTENSDTKSGLAAIETLAELGQYSKALNLALKIEKDQRKKQPSSPDKVENQAYLDDIIGFIYLQKKKYSDAKKRYAKNLSFEKNNASFIKANEADPFPLHLELYLNALFYSAEIQRLMENYDEALELYSKNTSLAEGIATNLSQNTEKDSHAKLQRQLFQGFSKQAELYDFIKADYSKAIEKYLSALGYAEGLSKKNELLYTLARVYLKADRLKQAIESLESIRPESGEIYYAALLLLAKTAFDKKLLDKSFSYYIEIINNENHPEYAPNPETLEKAYFERIALKAKKGHSREAYYYLGKMRDRFPSSRIIIEAYFLTADTFLKNKDYPNAARVFKETALLALEQNKAEIAIDAYFRAARSLLAAPSRRNNTLNKEQASAFLDTSINVAKANAIYTLSYIEALFEAGLLAADLGDLPKANNYFTTLVKTREKRPQNFREKNELFQEFLAKAEENLEKIRLYQKQSPYEGIDTIEDLKKAIREYKSLAIKAEGAEKVIQIHLQKTEFSNALEYLQQVQSLWPISSNLYLRFLQSLEAHKKYTDLYNLSLQLFLEDKFPNKASFREYLYYSAALSAEELNKNPDSLRFKEKLLTEFPDSPYTKKLE